MGVSGDSVAGTGKLLRRVLRLKSGRPRSAPLTQSEAETPLEARPQVDDDPALVAAVHATADADAAAAAAPLASSSGPYEGDVYARNGEEGENGPTTLSVTHVREGVTDPSEEQPESDGAVQPAQRSNWDSFWDAEVHDGARGAERFFSDAAPALPVHAARADEYEYSAFKHYLCWTDTTLLADDTGNDPGDEVASVEQREPEAGNFDFTYTAPGRSDSESLGLQRRSSR